MWMHVYIIFSFALIAFEWVHTLESSYFSLLDQIGNEWKKTIQWGFEDINHHLIAWSCPRIANLISMVWVSKVKTQGQTKLHRDITCLEDQPLRWT